MARDAATTPELPTEHLAWPFYEPAHRALVAEVDGLARHGLLAGLDHGDVDGTCRRLVARLGEAGLLRHCVPAAYGGAAATLASRPLCLVRETLAFHDGLADFAFVMQGLGSGPVSLEGSEAQKQAVLPKVAQGEWLAAFALSEPEAGSDVAALACTARRDGGDYVLDGEKTWISNGGIADFYVVFARTGEGPGTRGLSAFLVEAGTPGLETAERLEVIAPHPLARLRFTGCRLKSDALIGKPGEGFKLAMRNLDIFRASVAAAALGFGRRALAEAARHAVGRRLMGATLADLQLTQGRLADMATGLEAAALLTARAAWQRDVLGTSTTKVAAMAKLAATETAQEAIDGAVQLLGGRGVAKGEVVEQLYREIRALRIYEGASEVQKVIIARELLRPLQQRAVS